MLNLLRLPVIKITVSPYSSSGSDFDFTEELTTSTINKKTLTLKFVKSNESIDVHVARRSHHYF